MRAALILVAAGALGYASDLEEKSHDHRNFSMVQTVEVDDVNGSIRVSGHSGADTQMDVEKIIRADDAARVEAAKREVRLDITQQGSTLKLYVDGPFRCNCDQGDHHGRNSVHEHGRRGYRVNYDFQLTVPRDVKLLLSTVNGGEIRVEKTTGDFDIDNVNGGVQMTDVGGSGRVYALNGKVIVSYASNPARKSYFGSLNGAVEVSFRPGLAANALVKTFNGKIFTDFPAEYLPVAAAAPERRDGKFVYRSNDFTGVRIGKGGLELTFENFNGDIRILNRGQQ